MTDKGAPSLGRTGLLLTTALVAAAAGGLVYLAVQPRVTVVEQPASSTRRIVPVEASPTEPALIGRHAIFVIPLVNHGTGVVSIQGSEQTCSCVNVVHLPKTVAPGESAELIAQFEPSAYESTSEVSLTLSGTGFSPADGRVKLHTHTHPPFEGWPGRAIARAAAGRLRVVLDPAYIEAGMAVSVKAFRHGTTSTVGSEFEGGALMIDSAEGGVDLIVHFGDEAGPAWSGPVVIASF